MSTNPFPSSFRPKQAETGEADEKNQSQGLPKSFRPKERNGLLGEAPDFAPGQRQILGSLAEAGEQLISSPRRIGEGLEALIPETLLKKGAGLVGLEKGAENLIDFTKAHAPYKLFPTKEQAHKVTKSIFGNRLDPKNEFERAGAEVLDDFVDLVNPIGAGKLKPIKAGALAIGANLTGQTLKSLGFEKSTQELGKFTTMLLGSLINPGTAEKLKDKLYDLARNARPQNAEMASNSLLNGLSSIEYKLAQGGTEAWKTPIQTKIKELQEAGKSGMVSIEQLEEFKKSINRIKSNIWDVTKDSGGVRQARRWAEILSEELDSSLKAYGNHNPAWKKLYDSANEAHGAIEGSKRAGRYIQRNLPKIGASHVSATALATLLGGGVPAVAAGGLAAALTYPAVKAGEVINRIWKSPTLRKHYTDVISKSLAENSKGMLESLRKLSAGMDKEGIQ